MAADRDRAYVDAVDAARPELLGVATLMVDDPRAAEPTLDALLAQLYLDQVPAAELRAAALRRLTSEDAYAVAPAGRPGLELVDVGALPATAPILADLRRLSRRERAAIVLRHHARLSEADAVAVLEWPASTLAAQTGRALATLRAARRDRTDERLAEELRAAVPPTPAGSAGRADLERGRRLVRRRWLRRSGAVAAAIALVVLVTGQLGARTEPSAFAPVDPAPSSVAPVPTPTPQPSTGCRPDDQPCRAAALADWRTEIAAVTAEHLDPEHRYFSGFTFGYTPEYETPQIWAGEGGALGLELYRMDNGATEVFVQIATSRRHAMRCGTLTQNDCAAIRFLEGNRYVMSESTDLKHGLEVQYSPDGTQVITVAAYNTIRGRELPIERADLLGLVQDERLRLPGT